MARLDVLGATVRFGTTAALDGVDLTVGDGELVAVLGPSGSGKSTLLRAVAGLQTLDAGAIHIDGVDVGPRPPHKRGVGMMFQDHALFPHHDVATNVGFGLRMQHRPAAEVHRRVGELLDLVGLPGYVDRGITELSGGERQRIALARSLAPRPRLLCLDEPLSSLDAELRTRLATDVREILRASGTTALWVTHDPSEAKLACDRVLMMKAGRIG